MKCPYCHEDIHDAESYESIDVYDNQVHVQYVCPHCKKSFARIYFYGYMVDDMNEQLVEPDADNEAARR